MIFKRYFICNKDEETGEWGQMLFNIGTIAVANINLVDRLRNCHYKFLYDTSFPYREEADIQCEELKEKYPNNEYRVFEGTLTPSVFSVKYKPIVTKPTIGDNIEIERRFLMKRIPPIGYHESYNITQTYLSDRHAKKSERVRKISHEFKPTEFTHTIKEHIKGFSYSEEEKTITEGEYGKLVNNGRRDLEKQRLLYQDGDLVWELDVYKKQNLIIMEVELPSEDYELVIPDCLKQYVIMEVTGMEELSNKNLAE